MKIAIIVVLILVVCAITLLYVDYRMSESAPKEVPDHSMIPLQCELEALQ